MTSNIPAESGATAPPTAGAVILNLGCGTKVSGHANVMNIDWSISVRIRRNPILRRCARLIMDSDRYEVYSALSDNILVYDLARGIPYESDSVDAVFHSHLFEHLDRDVGRRFVTEVRRVLKPGGVHRVVVPDLEIVRRRYLDDLDQCQHDPEHSIQHDNFIEAMIGQCVWREAPGTSLRRPLRRRIENALLGDARKRGQTHQWMYDRVSLASLLASAGFRQISLRRYNESAIPNWESYGLEVTATGEEYKPMSLYVEAIK